MPTIVRIGWTASFVLLMLSVIGCGDSLPATVSGTVTLNGEPVKKSATVHADIMFYPTGGGAAAYGNLDNSGSYTVQTGGGKGLEPGEYVATVRVVETPEPPEGGFTDAPPQKLISPRRYGDRKESGFTFNIAKGTNDCPLAMTTDDQ